MDQSCCNNGQRTQFQEAEDLLKQCVEENALDSKLNRHFTADIEKRLQDLKDFNRSISGQSTVPSTGLSIPPECITKKQTDTITEVLESLRLNAMDDDGSVLSDISDEDINSDIDISNSESLSDNTDDDDDDEKEENQMRSRKTGEMKKKKKWLSRLVSFRNS